MTSRNSEQSRSSIKKQMGRISTLSSVCLSIVLGAMALMSFYIYSSMNSGLKIQQDLRVIKTAQVKLIEATLICMDIIVDKSSGQVMPSRQKELLDSFSYIETESFPIISKMYKAQGKAEKFELLKKRLIRLRNLSTKELALAIEAQESDGVFEQFDDAIDEVAEEMKGEFGNIISQVQSDLSASMASSRKHSLFLALGNILVLVVIVLGARILVGYIQKSIVDPMKDIAMSTIATLSKSATQLQGSTNNLDELMLDAAAATEQGAQKASSITSSVENVAAAIEELVSSISEIRRQATISTDVSNLAVKESVTMGETIKNLNVATDGISEITELINKIAEGTNLLALNATIEAARAGEAGKGFAVVATEVKNLAVKTAEATGDISKKISEMQAMSQKAVAGIGNIQETISEISTASSSVMTSVEQQSAATAEINRTLTEATDGLRITNESISDLNKTIHKTKQVSSIVLSSAQNLMRQADTAHQKTRQLIDSGGA